MDKANIFLELIDNKRNIYENATLFDQNRLDPKEYMHLLKDGLDYSIKNKILAYLENNTGDDFWKDQNQKFLNYHKSLTPFTFFNSIPIDYYIAEKTDLHSIKDKTVIDVGGGTGHFLTSFFRQPETLLYFLVDPNVRLLHDQFIRMYPQLLDLKMGHILALGENLPFVDEVADLVVSSSSIDHMANYKEFLVESHRVLKVGGKLLISSHLKHASLKRGRSIKIENVLESGARFFHRLKNKVSMNDHVLEFEDTKTLENEIKGAGFNIDQSEIFKSYFFIVASKY